MKREEIVKAIMELNEEEWKAFMSGINQITCEYGWDADLDDKEFIKEIWKNY